jgi:AcrR family transcriptional regulator
VAADRREPAIATRARPRSRRGEGERLRREIITKTARLLAETGDEEAVSIRAVAQAVGVTPPAIYLHFADKDELIHAVCEDTFRALDEFVEARVASVADPLERLSERGRAYVDFGVEHPEQYRVLFMGKARQRGEEAMEASGFTHLLENVEQCMAAGAIAAGDAMLVATGLWAVVHGVTSMSVAVANCPVDRDVLIEHLLAVQARGLAGS